MPGNILEKVMSMKRYLSKSSLVIIAAVFVMTLLFAHNSEAFWVWTPKDKFPENPKNAPKDTPEEQFDWAMRFYKNQEFKRSADEFIRLVAKYKESDLAPEAQYYAGRSFEELGKYYFAFENYQKTVDDYPYTKRLREILEREYNIAGIFQKKESPRLMDLELNVSLDRAITIYNKIIENSTFGEYADKSYFNMAECYRRSRKYNEAVDAYEKLITDYPQSSLVEESKYQLASTMYEASLDPDYDQESTDEALKKFERISKTTAIPSIAKEAGQAINTLRNRKADSILRIGEFYEKQKKYSGAIIYYKEIVQNYPDSSAAKLAGEKIELLKMKVKK